MGVFTFTFAYLLFIKFQQKKDGQLVDNSKKYYLIGACFILFFIAGFRHMSVGADTERYINHFRSTYFIGFFQEIKIAKEPGFFIFIKCIRSFTDNQVVFLSACSAFITYSIYRFIKKNSGDYCISILMFITLNYFAFTMAGLRQSMAISILLFAFEFVKKRKLIPFLLLVAIAYTFHNTAIVFTGIYFIAKVKINWKQIIVLVITLLIAVFAREYVVSFLFEILKWDRLEGYKNREEILTISGYIIKLCILVFCLFFRKRLVNEDKNNIILFNCMYCGLVFQSFAIVIAEFFRISMYFSIFEIILVSKIFNLISDAKDRLILYIGTIALLIIYFYFFGNTILAYRFFWNSI